MIQPKFKLDYTITPDELYDGLSIMKSVPSRGVGQIIRTILLLIVSGIVIYNMTIDNKYMTIGKMCIRDRYITSSNFYYEIYLFIYALFVILP